MASCKRRRRKKKQYDKSSVKTIEEQNNARTAHDVFSDLKDVYNDEINGSNYIQGFSWDVDSGLLYIHTGYGERICHRFAYQNKPRQIVLVSGELENPGISTTTRTNISGHRKRKYMTLETELESIQKENLVDIAKHVGIQRTLNTPKYKINMAKKDTTDIIQFRGIPVTGDINSFLKVLESKCGFRDFGIEEGRVVVDGYFVGVHTQDFVRFSLLSKTVFEIGVSLYNEGDKDYKYYKELYILKYGTPKVILQNEKEMLTFKTVGGRIELYDKSCDTRIVYINEENEKLAQKEQMKMFLDEI